MRLGVFGGTFDPVHIAHLFIASAAAEQFQLDRVLFIPNSVSPFKIDETITPVVDRLEMLHRAIGNEPRFAVSNIEADRPPPSYTVDTLRRISVEYPQAELHFLTGLDTALEIPTWREPEVIFAMATVIAATRPGLDVSLLEGLNRKVVIMPTPLLDLSSTTIRERLKAGQTVKYLVPDSVIDYMEMRRLYR